MVKDEAFYEAIEKAVESLTSRKSHHKLLCSSASELESLIDAYLQTDWNYMRTGIIMGISDKMATHRIRILIESGLDIEQPPRCAPLHQHSKEIARLYSEGLNERKIAEIYNVHRSTIGHHLRKLRDVGLINSHDGKSEMASLKKSCELHLADLYLHHAYRVRAIAA